MAWYQTAFFGVSWYWLTRALTVSGVISWSCGTDCVASTLTLSLCSVCCCCWISSCWVCYFKRSAPCAAIASPLLKLHGALDDALININLPELWCVKFCPKAAFQSMCFDKATQTFPPQITFIQSKSFNKKIFSLISLNATDVIYWVSIFNHSHGELISLWSPVDTRWIFVI